ncbi:MAG: hypothetical protein ACYDAE_27630 [Steroidobacteraceae bacterium]
MRYYSITISDPNSGESIVPDGQDGFTRGSGPTFTSLVNGQTDPGALQIDFDFPNYPFAQSQGAQRIKIYGVGLKMIGQAANLAGMNFSMKAGMAPGLPLANPAQAGLILQGNIFQAYGNWQGVDQTLDLVINPGVKQSIFSIPVPFWWPAGSSLDDAIDAALSAAFPGFKTEVFIDSNLTLANDEAGYYQNFAQFAAYLKGITLKLGAQRIKNYPGVDIAWNGDTISVFDGTSSGGPSGIRIQLNFEDLIGQPTWIGPAQVNFKTVLRADISMGNKIGFPLAPNGSPAIVTPYALTSPAAAVPNAPARSSTIFRGDFIVNEVHQFGSFREPDADSWATTFSAVPVLTSS